MRIFRFKEFLELPEGTLFCKYENYNYGGLSTTTTLSFNGEISIEINPIGS